MSKLSDLATDEGRERVVLPSEFSPVDRQILLRIAHESILSAFTDRTLPQMPLSPCLSEVRGVFTTLYLYGNLRGCIGYALPVAPLYLGVAETARTAAFEDSRFYPVTKDEASELKVSLSVLSPLFPIRPQEVVVGRHGLVVSFGSHRGLLLPQVPLEHKWDRETFLGQTCRKAGLPLDAWRGTADLEAFTAEVFGDNSI
jgi:AmmeMemoRadiSam system protein A